MYHVDYSKKAQKQIRKLDRHVQALLFAWIDKNLEGTDNPRLHGKGLTGNRSNEWRYRIGNYRVIVQMVDDELVVERLEVGHRREIYK